MHHCWFRPTCRRAWSRPLSRQIRDSVPSLFDPRIAAGWLLLTKVSIGDRVKLNLTCPFSYKGVPEAGRQRDSACTPFSSLGIHDTDNDGIADGWAATTEELTCNMAARLSRCGGRPDLRRRSKGRVRIDWRLTTLGYYQRVVPFGMLTDWDPSHFFESIRIDDGHRVLPSVGIVDLLAVGRESDPLRYDPGTRMSQQLEIRERVK